MKYNNKLLIKKIIVWQAVFSLCLLSSVLFFRLNLQAFLWAFCLSQGYACLLFLSGEQFAKGNRRIALSIIFLKYPLLLLILYKATQIGKHLSFFIGLISFISFFIIFAFLERED